jgi:hypothetical protein
MPRERMGGATTANKMVEMAKMAWFCAVAYVPRKNTQNPLENALCIEYNAKNDQTKGQTSIAEVIGGC